MANLDTRAIDVSGLPQEAFPRVNHGFRILIDESAFDHATGRGDADLTREVGGVLVGRLCKDESGPYLHVRSTIDALHAEEKSAELTFTHATWEHIHSEMDANHPNQQIVGWYHTHPGFGIFLSDRDTFIHEGFFNLPHQIALVYDPKSREHGVFAWNQGRLRRCRRYWVGVSENVWEGSYKDDTPAERSPRTASNGPRHARVSESEEPEMSTEKSLGGELLTLGTTLLIGLVLGGLGGWWLSGKALVQVERRAEREIADARVDGAREMARTFNVELLTLLRNNLEGQAASASLPKSLAALDSAMTIVSRGGRPDRTIEKLAEARRHVGEFMADRKRIVEAVATFESLGREGTAASRDVRRALSRQQVALGQIYAEMAQIVAAGGDVDRARRLLQTSVVIDPDNATRYGEQLEHLAGDGQR